MTHGGKREGAGRKVLSLDQRKVNLTIKVKPDVVIKLKERAKEENLPIGTLIENLL